VYPTYKLIQKFGDDITVWFREEEVDEDGHVTYEYRDTITVKGILVSATGLTEVWGVPGVYSDMDYVLCVYPQSKPDANLRICPVSVGDLIEIEEVYHECVEIIPRKDGKEIIYYECLLRRKE